MPPPKRHKAGRPTKINDIEEREILAVLTVGGSLRDAADYIGVDYSTLRRKRKSDDGFAHRLRQAVKKGKIHHLKKLNDAPQWQASAFMLERKWWKEFGRKDKVQAEHSGKDGGPIEYRDADLEKLSLDELRQYRAILAKATGEAQPGTN